MVLTAEQLRSIMPNLSAQKCASCLPFLTAAMTEFAIDTPARAAAFAAQLAHESGELRYMEELWGPTEAQNRYEPVSTLAARLGNTEPGDGKRFKGRGPIQLTGRGNYRTFGTLLEVDLVAESARAARPEVAFRIAALFWLKKGLNELADVTTAAAFKEITRRINGGSNGLAQRQAYYDLARRVLGVLDAASTRSVGRSLPPRSTEPDFTRGWEAVRADARRRPSQAKRKPKTTAASANSRHRPKAARPRRATLRKSAASARKR